MCISCADRLSKDNGVSEMKIMGIMFEAETATEIQIEVHSKRGRIKV